MVVCARKTEKRNKNCWWRSTEFGMYSVWWCLRRMLCEPHILLNNFTILVVDYLNFKSMAGVKKNKENVRFPDKRTLQGWFHAKQREDKQEAMSPARTGPSINLQAKVWIGQQKGTQLRQRLNRSLNKGKWEKIGKRLHLEDLKEARVSAWRSDWLIHK